VNTLRLWSSASSNEFDLQIFNHGDYVKAVEDKNRSEMISKVLYPNDNVIEGKELRLKQQYFFVSASLQDILRRYKKTHKNFESFVDKTAIQLNDTHPTIAIPELMRLLIDEEGFGWDEAWKIVSNVFAYTNHTVLPEALEKWPVTLVESLLPRHMQIIYEINHRFLNEVRARFPNDEDRVRRMSIIEEEPVKQIRMANLAIVGSKKINGVAKLHSEILKKNVFRDFYEMWPEKFTNVTNGITPRRWLLAANPSLANFITEKIGSEWITDLTKLRKLEKYANDKKVLNKLLEIKKENKRKLADYIYKKNGIKVDAESIFDVHVKRIHEYKRQFLNAMHIMILYNRLKKNPNYDIYPRTFIFGGKSAPGYFIAKRIISLINALADLINNDKDVNEKIKVVFLEDYRVSLSEKIIPATDVSEQISTAGKEASGTGNMKFALNGAITIGTMDGANIEIREEVGDENIFIFGLNAEEVDALKSSGKYNPWDYYNRNPEIKEMMDMLLGNRLRKNDYDYFKPLFDSIMNGDQYLLLADLESYIECQKKIDKVYRDKERWAKMMLYNIARVGKFSSDRAIRDYAREIWNIKCGSASGSDIGKQKKKK
ncbi:MAG: glycogen/starch/alpha-glucan phosphorylase, partial [Thermoplasmata archaeon]